jgi:hypothetical protein
VASAVALSTGNAEPGGVAQSIASAAAISSAAAVGITAVIVFAVGQASAHSNAQAYLYEPSVDRVVVVEGGRRVVEVRSDDRISISSTGKRVSRSK